MKRCTSDTVKTFIWISALIGHLVIAHMLLLKTFMRTRGDTASTSGGALDNDVDIEIDDPGYRIPGIVGASSIILYLLVSLSSFWTGNYDEDFGKMYSLTRTPFLLKFVLPSLSILMASLGISSVYHMDSDDIGKLAFTTTMPEESRMRLITLYLLDLLLIALFLMCSGLLEDGPIKDDERDQEEEIWTKPLIIGEEFD